MDAPGIILEIRKTLADFVPLEAGERHGDEIFLKVRREDFAEACLCLHKALASPVMMLFGADDRFRSRTFFVGCVFLSVRHRQWVMVALDLDPADPRFDSLSRVIYSASLFEREMHEMLGIIPEGHPDLRRLHLHDEVWPAEAYPLRKDFVPPQGPPLGAYKFGRVEGEGIFEVPVGPVHAGIIAPGHFRFSVAGEPIINLELRMGFTHRGAEKLFEEKDCPEAIRLAEVVCGDTSFAHSLAFSTAAEKIGGISVPRPAAYIRAIFLELERMAHHMQGIGGIALDVGFGFPAAAASVIKEQIHSLSEQMTESRYLRGVNVIGGVAAGIDAGKKAVLLETLDKIERDFRGVVRILEGSVSFMDRVDATGVLRRKTAEDLGIVGPAARACGIPSDLRKTFGGVYDEARFKMALEKSGDVLARLRVRIFEFEESLRLIREFAARLTCDAFVLQGSVGEGSALGFCEGPRGPVLYWVTCDATGRITRCKVVDASFRNWQGLSFAVLGNIIPDFPLCNKSFDLSYPGNDL